MRSFTIYNSPPTTGSHPLFIFPSLCRWFMVSWLMPHTATPLHLPWTSMGALPMLSGPYWTPNVVGVGFSTWWTGRGTAQRSTVGFWQPTSWTTTSSGISNSAVWTGPLLALGPSSRSMPSYNCSCLSGGILSCLFPLPHSSARRHWSTNHWPWKPLLRTAAPHYYAHLLPIITHTWTSSSP
jgi:hypothetical protein